MKFKPEQIKPLLEELRHADIFRIAYNAKKYNKMIIRHGVYDDNTRAWITKTDELAFTYYDLNQDSTTISCQNNLGELQLIVDPIQLINNGDYIINLN